MKSISGYLDITPGDFKEVFSYAYRHAVERIAQSFIAKDAMTAKVISVTSTTSLQETAATMAAHGISGIPVIDDRDTVVGVISEKDFLLQMGEKKTHSIMHVIAQCLSRKGCVAISMRTGHAKDIMNGLFKQNERDYQKSPRRRLIGNFLVVDRIIYRNRSGGLYKLYDR